MQSHYGLLIRDYEKREIIADVLHVSVFLHRLDIEGKLFLRTAFAPGFKAGLIKISFT